MSISGILGNYLSIMFWYMCVAVGLGNSIEVCVCDLYVVFVAVVWVCDAVCP